jgi:RHS repeat-associated protein
VVISATEYEIRYYRPADVGAKNGVYAVSGQPFVKWNIKNPEPSTLTKLQITKTQGAVTDVSLYTWDAISDSWTLSTGNGARIETSTISYPTQTSRVETVVVKDIDNLISSKISRTFHTFVWGERLIQEVLDPDGAALKTVYSYYENGSETGRYSRLKSIVNPDGSWELYDYDSAGNKVLVLRPWKDQSIANAVEDNSHAIRYTYSNSDGIITSLYTNLLSSVTEKIGGVTVRKTTYSRIGTTVNGHPAVVERQTTYSSLTESLVTTSTRYHATAAVPLANRTISTEYPDGRKQTVTYQKGNYIPNADPALSTFTPDANGLAERETTVHGTVTSPLGVQFKTLKETSVRDQNGNEVLQESYVYNGVDYERIAWLALQYDDRGHAIGSRNHKGEVTTAVWNGDLNTSRVDAAGVETVYTYDSLNRVKTQTKKGIAAAGGFPAQTDIITTFTYDADGRVTIETVSSNGLSLTISRGYDEAGRLIRETNRGGFSTDQEGLTTTYVYSNGGRTLTVKRPGEATEISDRYLDGQDKSTTGSAVVAQYFDYTVNVDGTRSTQEFVGPGGLSSPRWTKTVSDWLGRFVSIERPSFTGAVVVETTTYNSLGQLNTQITTANSTKVIADRLYEYDELGRQIRMGSDIDNSGTLTLLSTDRLAETDVIYEKVGSDWFRVTSSRRYLTDNNATPVIQTQRELLNNFPVSGSEQTVSEVTITDVAGNSTKTTSTVDRAAKRQTDAVDTPDSNINAVNVSINGLLQSSSPTIPQNAITYSYDSLGRQTSTVDPRTGTTARTFNTAGQVASTNDRTGTTTFEYYSNTQVNGGRLKTQINGVGKKTYFNYNNRGELIQTWGDTSYPLEYIYDSYGQRTELHTFRGGQNWSVSTWPASAAGTADVTKWIYQESTGHLIQKLDAVLKGPAYTYDELGRLKTRVWARGITCTYGYDENTGELRSITYSDNTPSVTFTYDRGGRQSGVTDAAGTHARTFNNAGALATNQITGGILDGVGLTLGYDSFLRRNSLQTLQGANTLTSQTYGYDATSQIQTVISGSQTATYAYYPNSGLLHTTTFSGGTSVARSYNGFGSLENITTTPAADVPQSYTYTYNSLNQRERVTREDGSYWSYVYNDRGELKSGKKYWADNSIVWGAQTEYNFDNIGNRNHAKTGGNQLGGLRQSNYTTNSLNQYSQRTVPGAIDVTGSANTNAAVTVNNEVVVRKGDYFYKELTANNGSGPVSQQINVVGARNNFGAGGEDAVTEKGGRTVLPTATQAFTYDFDGNLTSDGIWSYTWDAENRLISIESTAIVPVEVKRKLTFVYDYMSRRVQKAVYVWDVPSSSYQLQQTRRFIYDEWNLLVEIDAGNNVLRSYCWGQDVSGVANRAGGIGGLLLVTEAGTTYQVGYDASGNVTSLVNSTSGKLAAAYEYDPFGNSLRASGEYAEKNPFRFSTKYIDVETNLIYYGFRYYQPQTGTWLSRDPIEEMGGINLYAFAANDPVHKIDYLGLLDPYEFWKKWTERQRQDWYRQFREKYGKDINDAAVKNCVPKRLLAAIIANELIDYSDFERDLEPYGIGGSVGPAQIQIETAIRYNLTDIDPKSFSSTWFPLYVPASQKFREAVRNYMLNQANNIDAAARLMSLYLDELCRRTAQGKVSEGFLNQIARITKTADKSDFCCRANGDCKNVVDFEPDPYLIKAMAAIWNNGINVVGVQNPREDSSNAFIHAGNAGQLAGKPLVP